MSTQQQPGIDHIARELFLAMDAQNCDWGYLIETSHTWETMSEPNRQQLRAVAEKVAQAVHDVEIGYAP